MKHNPVPTNFIYPEVLPAHYRLGTVTNKKIVRPDRDWRAFLPPEEEQNIRGIESSACFVEGQQHTIATLEEAVLGEKDNNYSARFNALLSGGTESGGDPLKAADSIRNDGLVGDSAMPFGDNITSWEDFHSWKGVSQTVVTLMGKEYKNLKKLNNEIVFERVEPISAKYRKLREALQYSPCPISVNGWHQDDDGLYYKPEGSRDNHLVYAVYVDDQNHVYVGDTYAPFLKKLAPNYNFDFCMSWTVERRTVPLENENKVISLYQRLVEVLKKILIQLQA